MARVLFRDSEGAEGTVELSATDSVYVGRGLECAIRTSSNTVSRRHAQIRAERGRFVIEDLGSSLGTFVNNTRTEKHVFAHQDVVQCGSLYMRFIDDAPAEEVLPADEAALLRDIARGDDASRLVYADWLEQHADLQRAEYLRLQEALAHVLDGKASTTNVVEGDARIVRVRELAQSIPIAWRKKVANARAGDPCGACGNLRLVQGGGCRTCHPPQPTANPPPPGKECACGTRNAWFATKCATCQVAL